jgi:hypothetical protein
VAQAGISLPGTVSSFSPVPSLAAPPALVCFLYTRVRGLNRVAKNGFGGSKKGTLQQEIFG